MKTHRFMNFLLILLVVSLFLSACTEGGFQSSSDPVIDVKAAPAQSVDVEFTLQTLIKDGGLAYIGVGGEIDGIVNPDLVVESGAVVRVILVNGDGMKHDFFLPDFAANTGFVNKINDKAETIFELKDAGPGNYVYYCTVPGHRQAGQEGKLIVREP